MLAQSIVPTCRICMDSGGEMIKPCACTSLVHRDCLDRWRKSQPIFAHNNQRDIRCEVCHTYYQFEDVMSEVQYSKWLIARDLLLCMSFMQLFGFILGYVITGFGTFSEIIPDEYININLYQYILGATILHIIIATVLYCKRDNSTFGSRDEYCPFFIYIGGGDTDSDDEFICCITILFISFIASLVIILFAVYHEIIERSQKRQKIHSDTRRIRNLCAEV